MQVDWIGIDAEEYAVQPFQRYHWWRQNLKWVTHVTLSPDHVPLKGYLSSLCWDLTQPTCVQNLTTLVSAVPAIWLLPTKI